MRQLATLTRRELSVFFFSPIAYVVTSVFLVVSGIFFWWFVFSPGQEASLKPMFRDYLPIILVFVVPMLTMRLMSEEFRSGTIEVLMTAPVSDAQVILGKFLGTMIFYVVLIATTLLFAVGVMAYGNPDIRLFFSGYLGLLFLGGLFVAVGLFFSACTKHQVVAGFLTIITLSVFTFLANLLAQGLSGRWRVLVQHLSITSHLQDFCKGLIDTNHVVFFLTSIGLFLFLAVKVLESRRWR